MTRQQVLKVGEPVLFVVALCGAMLAISAREGCVRSASPAANAAETVDAVSDPVDTEAAATSVEQEFNECLARCAAGDQGTCHKLDALQQRLSRIREHAAEYSTFEHSKREAKANYAGM